MSIVSQNNTNEVALVDCIQRFFSKHQVGKLLKKCNGTKEKGVPAITLLRYKLGNIFVGKSMYMQQKIGSFKEEFSKNTFYRFLNSTKTSWYLDYALVGTKGYTFEGPFRVNWLGHIIDWGEEDELQAKKLVQREAERLKTSFEAARAAGYEKFIMFLHYPPTSILEEDSIFTRMAEEYGAEHVVYSHCHGESRFADSIRGMKNGIQYHLVSGDYLYFKPERILD